MMRILPAISLMCALVYFHLPFPAPHESELKRVYDAWVREWKKEDVIVLRVTKTATRAAADRLRARALAAGFDSVQKESIADAKSVNGDIGEWSASQLDEAVGQAFRRELFAAKVGDISRIVQTKDQGAAFYLVVSKRQRTIPTYGETRDEIAEWYDSFRETKRWTSWLPFSEALTDGLIIEWYSVSNASRH
jgi:hypothetical protein